MFCMPMRHSQKMEEMMKKISLLIIALLVSACDSEKAGLAELKRLCEKDAGLTIYKTVEADGYYDSYTDCHHCWKKLIKSNYQFVEFCAEEEQHPLSYILADRGCFRIFKTKRNQNICHARIDQRLSDFKADPYPEFLKEHCIAVDKIEKPMARYTYEVERKDWWINEGTGTKMTWGAGRIIDTKTNEILGERISYGLFPKWYGTSRSKPHVGCGSYKMTGKNKSEPFAIGLIEKTLLTD